MTTDTENLRERIVDAALELAEQQRSWETVRLHAVATRLGITLADIGRHFREKEDVVEAWFDRADRAMLATAASPEFRAFGTRERLHRVIMTWLTALGPHRRVTRQMIFGKLEPGHLHVQIPGLLRVSRTVQWMREAAGLTPPGMTRRAVEEVATTSIYLMTFVHWMVDESPQSVRTSEFLDRRLKQAERVAQFVNRSPRTSAADYKVL
jgi:AcrR family transcriptional regulator